MLHKDTSGQAALRQQPVAGSRAALAEVTSDHPPWIVCGFAYGTASPHQHHQDLLNFHLESKYCSCAACCVHTPLGWGLKGMR